MLVLVGIDSQFVGVEGFVVAITDMLTTRFALKKNVREWITLAVCVISCLFGISMVTKVSKINQGQVKILYYSDGQSCFDKAVFM